MAIPAGRIPFVGRDAELAALHDGLAAAVGGQGSVVLVAGEPGAGKTRLAQEFSERAEAAGAAVLWGRCYEGEGAPAYWPWVELLRAYLRTRVPDALRAELGVGAVDIAQLVPEVGEHLPDLPALPVLEPAQARFRLFDHLSAFVGRATTTRPLVFVLDDLHWADVPSLLLLEFLARDLESRRLLVVGTYRDVEVGRDHPLTNTLAELARRVHVARLQPAGLTQAEAGRVIEHATGVRPAPQRTAAMLEETEGNPLFVLEMARLLATEQRLTRAPSAGERTAVPDTVRGVIGRRLSRLTPACLRALTVAAVLGREFSVAWLSHASELDAEAVLGILEEAEGLSLVATVAGAPGRWRFSHALIRETLYDGVPAARRVQLHRQVGAALEAWDATEAESHAAELAHHFGAAAVLGHGEAAKAVRYSRLAAEQAERLTAWEEAARHYERCLTLLAGREDTLGEDEAAVTLAMARCHHTAAYWLEAEAGFARALDLYRGRGDPIGVAQATLGVLLLEPPRDRRIALAETALTILGKLDPHLTALLLTARAGYDSDDAAKQAAAEAAVLARTHGYADVQVELAEHEFLRATLEGRMADAFAITNARLEQSRLVGDRPKIARHMTTLAETCVGEGKLDEAEGRAEDALEYARTAHLRLEEMRSQTVLAGIALARHELHRFDGLVQDIGMHNHRALLLRSVRAEWAGDLERALALAPQADLPGVLPRAIGVMHGNLARIRFNSDDRDGARRELVRWRQACLADVHAYSALAGFAAVDDSLAALGDDEVVQAVYDDSLRWRSMRFTYPVPHGFDHIRGALALRLGRVDEAETWYRTGLDWAERERCPVEQGRCLQGLAEVSIRRGQHTEAMPFLERAASIFEQYGARLYLKQVQAMQARVSPSVTPATTFSGGLSAREAEVLRLLAAGKSNQEIADALVLSVRTVENHTASIYAKIGARSRAEATAYAFRRGLV